MKLRTDGWYEADRCCATYATFKQIDAGTWEYCGDCFRGENVRRGTPTICRKE